MSRHQDMLARVCSELFISPVAVIEHARVHRIVRPFQVETHTHADLVQLDLLIDCQGTVCVGDQQLSIPSRAAVFVPAAVPHSMNLAPLSPEAVVYHLRLSSAASPLVNPLDWNTLSHVGPASQLAHEFTLAWHASIAQAHSLLDQAMAVCRVLYCWPQESERGALDQDDSESIDKAIDHAGDLDPAMRLIDQFGDTPPSVQQLADAACLSVRHFTRRFTQLMGATPLAYLDRRRHSRARELLLADHVLLEDIARQLGFASGATFSRWFRQKEGVSPGKFRNTPVVL
jgi:AraC-like DNA-binding protein